jgi:hypothetical protein
MEDIVSPRRMTFSRLLIRLVILALFYGMFLAVWRLSGFIIRWFRTKRELQKGKIPPGPPRREVYSMLGGHDPHRVLFGWVEKYGGIFYNEFLHLHVRPLLLMTDPSDSQVCFPA